MKPGGSPCCWAQQPGQRGSRGSRDSGSSLGLSGGVTSLHSGQQGQSWGPVSSSPATPLALGADLPRPRLAMVLRSVKLLASRMACGSLSVKGSKSLWKQEGSRSCLGGSCVSIATPTAPAPRAHRGGTPAAPLAAGAFTRRETPGVEGTAPRLTEHPGRSRPRASTMDPEKWETPHGSGEGAQLPPLFLPGSPGSFQGSLYAG